MYQDRKPTEMWENEKKIKLAEMLKIIFALILVLFYITLSDSVMLVSDNIFKINLNKYKIQQI